MSAEQRATASLIKLDVEGHEYEVLSGAVMTLKESSPLILFEINVGEIKDGSTKAKEFLQANNYNTFIISRIFHLLLVLQLDYRS